MWRRCACGREAVLSGEAPELGVGQAMPGFIAVLRVLGFRIGLERQEIDHTYRFGFCV